MVSQCPHCKIQFTQKGRYHRRYCSRECYLKFLKSIGSSDRESLEYIELPRCSKYCGKLGDIMMILLGIIGGVYLYFHLGILHEVLVNIYLYGRYFITVGKHQLVKLILKIV